MGRFPRNFETPDISNNIPTNFHAQKASLRRHNENVNTLRNAKDAARGEKEMGEVRARLCLPRADIVTQRAWRPKIRGESLIHQLDLTPKFQDPDNH